jgi:CheY-like chemotaxis protein
MTPPKYILIAEDDEADVVLMRIVFKKCGIAEQVVVTRDGEETLDYLHCRGPYLGGARFAPGLVLLDLKMPKLSGLEVLKQIRSDARLQATPVVIFTSSLDEEDKAECLAGGADEFVIKPINFEAYAAELERIVRAYATN